MAPLELLHFFQNVKMPFSQIEEWRSGIKQQKALPQRDYRSKTF